MTGFLFPGQGSQTVGMGAELYNNCQSAKIILDSANDILGYDLGKLMFEGPQEDLTNTEHAQPAIYTCSAMYLEKAKELRYKCDYCAGHSLGEYDALLAAGVFDFGTGLELVAARGAAMAKQNGKGTMAAVIGLSVEELEQYLKDVNGVVIANINSQIQNVISGTEDAVDEVGRKLETRENVKFKKLHVSAAFHSPQMMEAGEKMADLIDRTHFNEPQAFVIPNFTGKPTKESSEIKCSLINQMTGQVRWYDTVMAMKAEGVSALYEVGYGDVLKKLNKAITFRPKCVGIEI